MSTEVATSNEPDASRRAGMQKRARNLAAKELLIEVMASRGWKGFGEKRVEYSSHQWFQDKN